MLCENQHIRQNEIAVITPWREQVWRLREKLRGQNLGEVDVGNVEVSFVMTNPFPKKNLNHGGSRCGVERVSFGGKWLNRMETILE